MLRLASVCLLLCACGDLEGSRVCLNGPCAVPGRPSPECLKYVDCAYATGSATPGSLDSTYGEGGACWSIGPSGYDACTTACTQALQSLRSAFPGSGC